MVSVVLVLAAMGAWMLAALLALSPSRERLHQAVGLLGAALALGAAVLNLCQGGSSALVFPLWGQAAKVAVDPLSAAFLVPVHLLSGLAVLYVRSYLPAAEPKGAGRWVRCFQSLLTVGLSLVLVARQGMLFLAGWELMALSAMFLVATEHDHAEVRQATWIYLVCTHTGTLILTAMVLLLGHRLGGFQWELPAAVLPPAPRMDAAILVLAVLGFGIKAGLAPLHFWLPGAHAGAPSHVSALLSGVMLKTGVYGLLRVSGLLPPLPHLGGVLMAAGGATALLGVGCALAQRDCKRLLAYSSVENIGVIFLGIGLGLAGRSLQSPWLMALGFGGAVLHVWNHAVAKGLLFMGAGAVLHATGSRDLERQGGLARRMPRTALLLLPPALALSALPPFGAFVSEWFLYRGCFGAFLQGGSWAAGLAIAALALAGGLAALAFVKFYGFLFLGTPRSRAAETAHDPGGDMLAPMGVLALLCLALGLGARALLPALDRVTAVVSQGAAPSLAPGLGRDLALLSLLAALLLVLGALALRWTGGHRHREDAPPTWDCGYAEPTARMQYSAASFARGWSVLVPGHRVRLRRIRALFPHATSVQAGFQDPVGDRFLARRTERLAQLFQRFRRLQQGHLSMYLLYILVTLVGVFLWMILRSRLTV